MGTLRQKLITSAMRQKHKHDLDDHCINEIEELFSHCDGTQSYINLLLDEKLADLESRIEYLESNK